MITVSILSEMLPGKVIDETVLFGALAQICLCLAVAFWLFAAVRFVGRAESHDRADLAALAVFSAQVGFVVTTAFVSLHGRA